MRTLANAVGIALFGYLIYCAAVVAVWVWLIAVVIALLKLVAVLVMWASFLTLAAVVLWAIVLGVVGLFSKERASGARPVSSLRMWPTRHPKQALAALSGLVAVVAAGFTLTHGQIKESPPAITLANMTLRNDGFLTRKMIQTRLWFGEPAVLELGDTTLVRVGDHVFKAEKGKWVER